jgi:Zn-dependent protease with chaperone function
MDFFAHQENARRRTTRLAVLFALAVLAIVVAIYTVVIALFSGFDVGRGGGWWQPEVFLLTALGTSIVVALGSLYKINQLRAGGEVVARQLGGRPLQPNTGDLAERRLWNVVEEMAIASGVPVPSVYVLDGEGGINAFAAGFTPGTAVIGVTRGCLEQLDRDQLQGVIAHELSHVLNGDMRLNIRLLGVLHGILCIAMAGYVILRSGASVRTRGRNGAGAIAVLAVGLIAIGWVGVLFARLIQAGVSRQREFLADASAVQFTRNPDGIAGALEKIGGYPAGSRVRSPQAPATSHMFFGNALRPALLRAFATHPPLEERIRRIDASFRAAPAPAPARPAPAPSGLAATPAGLVAQTGRPTGAHLAQGRDLLRELPLAVAVAVREPFSARALVFALTLGRDAHARHGQLAALRAHADGPTVAETMQLADAVRDLDPALRLPIVDLALPALRAMSESQFRAFARAERALVLHDQRIDLFEFALQKVLLRHLARHYAREPYRPAATVAPDALRENACLVLAALAREGHADDAAAQAAYAKGCAVLADGGAAPPRPAHADLAAVDAALDRLALATPADKQRVLLACAEAAAHDGVVQRSEAELVRAIADTLDCPMPPLLAAPVTEASRLAPAS